MIACDVVWSPVEGHGFELTRIDYREKFDHVEIVSDILGVHENAPFSALYSLLCYPNWEVKEISLSQNGYENQNGNPDTLYRSKDGHWTNHRGEPYPEFDGFSYIDITLTPLTNTLPIRHLNLKVGESRDINVVYFEAPLLRPCRDPQRYTHLEKRGDGSLYRFEALDTGFVAHILVDADGLVVDYPGLFKRVWAK